MAAGVLAFGDVFDAVKLVRRSSPIALSISEPAGVEMDLSWAPERAPGPHPIAGSDHQGHQDVLRPRGGFPR